jgi:hypothetical protein
VSALTDYGNGYYAATITSSTTPGSVTVTAADRALAVGRTLTQT